MARGKVELKKFTGNQSIDQYEYLVSHDNGTTTLEQTLVIQKQKQSGSPSWISEMQMNDFPAQDTQEDSALKLAEWLERMAKVIRSGNYIELSDSNFIEID